MKSTELKPTTDNLIDTLENNKSGRNDNLFGFIKILESIEGNASIALNGDWGSGKTFFVKQAILILEALNKYLNKEEHHDKIVKFLETKGQFESLKKEKPLLPVYFDTWANDDDKDPIVTLLYEINKQIAYDYNFYKKDYGAIFFNIVDLFIGKNANDLYESLKGEDLFEKQKEDENLMSLVNKYFNTIIAEKANKIVIFIDELDRCKPSYAVKFLERIKHYFDNENVIFVFSINKIQLEHTINNCYGDDFDSTRYLDRFFTWNFELPKVNMQKYFSVLGVAYDGSNFQKLCNKVINYFDLQMREIPKYLDYVNSIYNNGNICERRIIDKYGNASNFVLIFFIPYIVGLMMKNTENYTSFKKGKDCKDYINFILNDEEIKDWIFRYLNFDESTISGEDAFNNKIKQIITGVYNAVFTTTPDNRTITVENMQFDNSINYNVLRALSLIL